MNTIYNTHIPGKLTCKYLDFLIDKVFALLPMFEDSILDSEKMQTMNGNIQLINYDSPLVLDILSHLQSLFEVQEHSDYRRHIFKICKLLSELKKEVV